MTSQTTDRIKGDSFDNTSSHPAALVSSSLLVLIVDDDKTNRLILSTLIKKLGYRFISADNGQSAIDNFKKHNPDIILMDVMMPIMNGYDAAVEIKQLCGDDFIPIIFLTAITDENALAKCIECGGDDFITKPYNRIIIKAKLDAMVRVRGLYNSISDSRAEIREHHNRLQVEHEIAESIFTNITNPKNLDNSHINYFLKPMSITSGDILLCARTPSGGMHVMLGDFTGHGLSAAIGAIPVSDTFYKLSSQGYSIGDIAYHINKKLKETLPSGFFCAACLIEADSEFRTIAAWNGGSPDIIITSQTADMIKIPSTHLPLGILNSESLDRSVEFIELTPESRIYMYSDGVIEALNTQAEAYTQQRLEHALQDMHASNLPFSVIESDIVDFCLNTEQSDDITLIEVTALPLDSNNANNTDDRETSLSPSKWALSIKLEADALKNTNPCPLITQSIMEVQGLTQHRERIYTILSELFSNSLEHGLLKLSSSIKDNPQGFIEYYNAREAALKQLNDAFISINIDHIPSRNGGILTIRLEDSSDGFVKGDNNQELFINKNSHGRGIILVTSLCESLEYKDKGRTAVAKYTWENI